MERPVPSTNRVLSYYNTEEWVQKVCAATDTPVDFLITWKKRGWRGEEFEFPSNASFILTPRECQYRVVVVPLAENYDGVAKEMSQGLANHGTLFDTPVYVLVDNDKDRIRFDELEKTLKKDLVKATSATLPALLGALGPRNIKQNRVKQRWPLMRHPGWQRQMSMVASMLSNNGGQDPKGSLTDLDAGDGALLDFLRKRFGEADCNGLCWNEDEKEQGRAVVPGLPLSVGMEGEMRDAGHFTCVDADPDQLDGIKEIIEKHCKVRAVVTIQKELGCPDVFKLWDEFARKDWQLIESASHYTLIWEAKHE